MVNFGSLAAEIDPVVWGTRANFICTRTPPVEAGSGGRRSNFPCSGSRRAAPVHAHFDHAHPSPAGAAATAQRRGS